MAPDAFLFTHSPAPENRLILESICPYCHLPIGASSRPELLPLLERAHCCYEKMALLLEGCGSAPNSN